MSQEVYKTYEIEHEGHIEEMRKGRGTIIILRWSSSKIGMVNKKVECGNFVIVRGAPLH